MQLFSLICYFFSLSVCRSEGSRRMRAARGEVREALHRHPPHIAPAASVAMVVATGDD
jgi:hypothetical protein